MTDRTICFAVLSLILLMVAPCCVDRREYADGAISQTTTISDLPQYTLAQTRTTLMPDAEEKAVVEGVAGLLEAGRLDDALKLAEGSTNPEVLVYLNNAAVNYTREKRYEEADKVFSGILRGYPNQPDIWYNKGTVDADLGRHLDAVNAFSNATKLKPEDPGAWYQMASSLYYLGRYEEAADACNRSLELDPGNPYAWYNMGLALVELKKFDDAIYAYDRAIGIKPDYAEAENNKGNALSELGRYDEALFAYDRALALKDDGQTKKNRDMAEAKLNETK